MQVLLSGIESRIDALTRGLNNEMKNKLINLLEHSKDNTATIIDYLDSMRNEINPSTSYQIIVIKVLIFTSKFLNHKSYKEMTKDDLQLYLNSLKSDESTDPLHKWIATHNTYMIYLTRFFKWLYYPNLLPNERQKPECVKNILGLKRKERSIYKPTDLWSTNDDILFLRYCPSIRDRCYHSMLINHLIGCL